MRELLIELPFLGKVTAVKVMTAEPKNLCRFNTSISHEQLLSPSAVVQGFYCDEHADILQCFF